MYFEQKWQFCPSVQFTEKIVFGVKDETAKMLANLGSPQFTGWCPNDAPPLESPGYRKSRQLLLLFPFCTLLTLSSFNAAGRCSLYLMLYGFTSTFINTKNLINRTIVRGNLLISLLLLCTEITKAFLPRCLKITEKVSFNIASEASYVYIQSS